MALRQDENADNKISLYRARTCEDIDEKLHSLSNNP